MLVEGDARRVTVFVGESDRFGHKPLAEAIVELLHAEGCAGATVTRGTEGFGKTSRIHSANILRLSEDLPVVVTWVDTAERVDRVLPKLDGMMTGGLVTIDDVHVHRYSADEGPRTTH